MSSEPACQKCGASLRKDSLQGLCRRCLARLAFDTPASQAGPASAGRVFGDYEVLGEIARGGMGVVYKARQISLNRLVALKMILHGPFSNQEFVRRFQIEAEAVARLNHPNIVTIYEVGERDGHRYLAMEYIDGPDFAALARDKPLPPRRAAEYVRCVAEAIDYAHSQGIIHRDLKPSNLLLDATDRPRVTDFGLAKLMASDTALTITGQALGSPGYMAPERASGGKTADAGPQGDVYSLGAVLYCLATCHPPFQGETLQDILLQIHHSEPIPPRRLNPAMPADLETICLKCLHTEPSKRYAGARDLAEDLGRFLAGEPIHAQPVSNLEKVRLWCRKRPIQTALSVALALAMFFGLTGILLEWRRATEHASGEERQRQVAENYAQKVRLDLYAADISLAAQAVQRGDYGLARRTLAGLQPKPGEEDLRGFEWRYLQNLARGSQLATLAGHTWIVTCAAFSPDGSLLATGSQDGTVKVWDAARQDLSFTLTNKGGAVWSVGFSPDGSLLMAAGNVRQVEFWDVAKRALVATIPGQLAVLSRSGSVAAVARSSPFYWENAGGISLWDYRSAKKIRDFDRPGRNMALSPDGKLLAVAQPERGVEIWDADSGEVRQTLATSAPAWSVAFSPDGRKLLTAGWTSEVLVWTLGSGEPPAKLLGHSRNVWSAVYSPDGASIATTGSDQSVRFWDAATLQSGAILRGHGNEVWCEAFAPGGKLLATGGKDQMVMLWPSGRSERAADVPNYQYFTPTFSPGGKWAAIMVSSKTGWLPEVWDLESRKVLASMPLRETIAFSTNEDRAFLLDGSRASLEIWSPGGARETVPLEGLAPGEDLHTFGFSQPPGQFFGVNQSGLIRCWDAATGKARASVQGPPPPIRCAALGPHGRWLALTLEHENSVRLYQLPSGKMTQLTGHRDFVGGLAFSPDGTLLASASMDGTVKLWDCASAKETGTLPGHLEETTGVTFSPDGRTLASVARNDGVKLWHLATMRELISIDYPKAGNFVEFTPDGTRLAVTTTEDTLHFFEAPRAEIEKEQIK
ncbi:MAG TPA: serine/threonine-protein kinase [Verrucomicrobiae bacterium]|jgi:WD40 repeat protein/predicted Ser/Thr protein kinase